MKIAIFGGTGFLGYDFVRYSLKHDNNDIIIYSSNPKNLTNVSRHDVDIRLYSSSDPQAIILDEDVKVIVNYSHPFESRTNITAREQIKLFVNFLDQSKRKNPELRLIHLSSMSVFEPFNKAIEYDEEMPLNPPKEDRYAQDKVFAEKALRQLPESDSWQLHLRPTVVYGPFCGVWTDRILEAFHSGDVGYIDLSGKIQPIFGSDVTKFIYDRIFDFQPGIYNMPGPDIISWFDFASVFQSIVNKGQLVKFEKNAVNSADENVSTYRFYKNNFRELMHVVRKEPSFDRMASRIATHLPERAVNWSKSLLLGRENITESNYLCSSTPSPSNIFSRMFFSEDRLVSDNKIKNNFSKFKPRSVDEVKDKLAAYYHYRFTDTYFT